MFEHAWTFDIPRTQGCTNTMVSIFGWLDEYGVPATSPDDDDPNVRCLGMQHRFLRQLHALQGSFRCPGCVVHIKGEFSFLIFHSPGISSPSFSAEGTEENVYDACLLNPIDIRRPPWETSRWAFTFLVSSSRFFLTFPVNCLTYSNSLYLSSCTLCVNSLSVSWKYWRERSR